MSERLGRLGSWALLGTLTGLVAVNLPELGSDPWPFRSGPVDPHGVLAPLVRAAGEEWDVGIARAGAFLAALLVALVGAASLRRGSWPGWVGAALVLVVALMLLLPSTLLQIGLRDATAPWFHTNDSTYQIELAGELVLDGESAYGHDFRASGLERFYTRDGSVSSAVREREVALEHFAYFPGSALSGALWSLLPDPFDDYRLLVLLATVASLGAVMLFRAPLAWRLALGAIVVANPITVRSAWFGQNDAPSILLVILTFALVTRGSHVAAAASLGAAVLLKQFALVAVPFVALMMLKRGDDPARPGGERTTLKRAAAAFGAVVLAGALPFLIADPRAFYEDTVTYGAGTYRIVGYGLSAILVRIGVIDDREGAYPFVLIALLTWLPLTAWLLLAQHRARELWIGAAGFAISILVLMFIGRTFNNYYLVWPMTGALIAALVAGGERTAGSGGERTGLAADAAGTTSGAQPASAAYPSSGGRRQSARSSP